MRSSQVLRERGREVFYVHDLLAEALAASDEAREQADRGGCLAVHGRLVDGRRGA